MTNEEQILAEIKGVNKQLTILNGSVKTNKGNIKNLDDRVSTIEEDGIEHKGFERGKRFMKTSTRNLLILICSILIAVGAATKIGVSVFKTAFAVNQKEIMAEIATGMDDRFTGEEGKAFNTRITNLENQINNK